MVFFTREGYFHFYGTKIARFCSCLIRVPDLQHFLHYAARFRPAFSTFADRFIQHVLRYTGRYKDVIGFWDVLFRSNCGGGFLVFRLKKEHGFNGWDTDFK